MTPAIPRERENKVVPVKGSIIGNPRRIFPEEGIVVDGSKVTARLVSVFELLQNQRISAKVKSAAAILNVSWLEKSLVVFAGFQNSMRADCFPGVLN